MKFEPYLEYQDSGLPSLERIPSHWESIRVKHLFREIDDRTPTGIETLLSMRQKFGLIPHNDVSKKTIAPDVLVGYKRTQPNDLVLNRMQACNGMFARTPMPGLVSPDYAVFRPIADVNIEFLVHLFRIPKNRARFRQESKGLGTGMSGFLRLYSDRFGAMRMSLPPRKEQDQIVAFLRDQDRQIAKLIRGKRRLIELLNEQKQIIIHRAVTRGLNPDVPLKPSGIDWLGDVPTHWDVLKIKTIAAFNPSRSEAESYKFSDQMATFVPMECVTTTGKLAESEIVSIATYWEGYTYFRRNDVVVAKITPCFENGKGACFDCLPTEFGFGTTEFVVLRVRSRILPKFLYQLTALRTFRKSGAELMTGSAGQQRVPLDFIRNFPVPVPPLNEQRVLLGVIATEEQHHQQAIDQTAKEIRLILEYRDRLISDVVTGQIDVRGWQPANPIPEDEESIDVLVNTEDDSEIGEDDGDDEHP